MEGLGLLPQLVGQDQEESSQSFWSQAVVDDPAQDLAAGLVVADGPVQELSVVVAAFDGLSGRGSPPAPGRPGLSWSAHAGGGSDVLTPPPWTAPRR